jgi:hypothetical protein
MSPILPVHIAAGSVGIITGTIALFAMKGGITHRRSGVVFTVAMTVMASTAAVISLWPPINPGNILQSLLTIYLVVTALVVVRPRTERTRCVEIAALLTVSAIALTHLTLGVVTLNSAAGQIGGYNPPMFFVFGSIALLCAAGDVRLQRVRQLRVQQLTGPARLARHLWRMCFALFLATGSFFLGQADEFPEALRLWPVLTVLALFPLVAMAYWLWRVRIRRSLRGLVTRAAVPSREGTARPARAGTAASVVEEVGR